MPYKYKIFHEKKTIVVLVEGEVDLKTSIQAMKDVTSDKDFHSQHHVVVDLRKMKYDPPAKDIFRLRDTIVTTAKNFKGEITLVNSKETLHIVKLFCMLAKAYHMNINSVQKLSGLDELEKEM